MNYTVLPGKGQAFEDVFQAVLKAMQGMPGHRCTRLYRDVQQAQRYLIVSDWADRPAFERFIGSEQFRKVADWGKQQILAERPTHEYYERPGSDSTAAAGCPAHRSSEGRSASRNEERA